MLVLITYDVNTEDAAGRKRLRHIAKLCVNYGQRVQNSVFECLLDPAQCRLLKAKLLLVMDEKADSLRLYYLGDRYQTKVEHFGAKSGYDPEGTLSLSCEGEAYRKGPVLSHRKKGDSSPDVKKLRFNIAFAVHYPDVYCRICQKKSGSLLSFTVAPLAGSVD